VRLIDKSGEIEIWEVQMPYGFDYYVYGITLSGDPIVCPSLGMAREKAAI